MLALFLGDNSVLVVRGALEVLQILSSHRQNHGLMLQIPYFDKALLSTAKYVVILSLSTLFVLLVVPTNKLTP